MEFGEILGQADLAAATPVDVFTAGSARAAAVCAEICNRNATSIKFRIAVRSDGAVLSGLHYVIYDATLPANATFEWGAFPSNYKTISNGDALSFESDTANVSVTVYGKSE